MEILAVGNANESNYKQLQRILESYRDLLLPGMDYTEEKKLSYEEMAKERLADETKKIYYFSKHEGGKESAYKKIAESDNPVGKAFVAREEREYLRAQQRAKKRREERKRDRK